MRDFVLTLLLTIALIMAFSILGPQIEVSTPKGHGTQQQGDSGMVIPGEGTESVEVSPSLRETEPVAEMPTEVESETVVSEVMEVTIEKEELNTMSEILTAFWHGVAVVILGEVAAILIAIAWAKIKGVGNNG